MKRQASKITQSKWPAGHLHTEDNKPVPYHLGQKLAMEAPERIIAMIAGSQGGKTSLGSWWIYDEIKRRGGGDYLAVTSTFDMFKLKMLPAILNVYEEILKIGRYWTGDRIIELADPETGKFLANKSQDRMWGRIILRSADALGGLESSTAKAAWLDECGQDGFTILAYKAIRRRLALMRGRMFMTTTLYQLGWLINLIIDPVIADGKTSTYYIRNGQMEGSIDHTVSEKYNTCLVQFDSIINPLFPEEEFKEQKELLSDEEFEMQYRGRKGTRRFLIYDSFKDINGGICDPFPIPITWRRYLGVDFGGTNTAAVKIAEEPVTGRLFLYDEYFAGGKTISEYKTEMMQGEYGLPTRSAGGAKSEGQWRREFAQAGLPLEKADIDDVWLGINRVYAVFKTDGIMIFKNCHGVIGELRTYRKKRDKNGTIIDEIENKSNYHYLDAVRYILQIIRPGTPARAKVVILQE